MDTTQGTLYIYTYARGILYTRRVLVESHKCTAEMARTIVESHRVDGGESVLSQSAYDYIWRADSVIL